MKFLSWNLYNFYDYKYFYDLGLFADIGEAKNFITRRLRYYKDEILKIDPDIIYFYEVGDGELLKKLAKEMWADGFYIFETTPDKRGIFNACLSKMKLDNSEVFLDNLEIPNFVITEESYTNKYLIQKRGYIKTELSGTNIYAVHLKSQIASRIKTESGEDYEAKNSVEKARAEVLGELIGLAESYGLRKTISTDLEAGREVIIMGDFNAPSLSKRVKILMGDEDASDGLISLFALDDVSKYSHIYKNNKLRFDHVLCSKNISYKITSPVMHTEHLNVANVRGSIDVKIIGSDHSSISFELDL